MSTSALSVAHDAHAAHLPARRTGAETESLSVALRFREAWVSRLEWSLNDKLFEQSGHAIPRNVRISCGIPSGGRLPRNTKRAAITYDRSCSTDDTFEVALNPLIDNSFRVATALGEQFIYIVNGLSRGRDASFKRIAAAVDLRGPAQRMIPGPAFKRVVEQVLLELGPYPHAALDTAAKSGNGTGEKDHAAGPVSSGPRAQTARLIKAQCRKCGLTLRLASKWIQNRKLSCPDMNCAGHSEPLTIS